jgi:outer membrane receptor for ferrienterochelin and colicin
MVMATVPHTLATVTVQDTLGELVRLPRGVIDRIRHGMGTYITAADIERSRPIRTSQILQSVVGAEVTKDGAINNTRGIVSLKTPGCKYGMPVYIDGARLADPHIGADTLHGSPLVDYVPPSAVAAIEVYRGTAELPGSLPQDKCGGVFIWTKR